MLIHSIYDDSYVKVISLPKYDLRHRRVTLTRSENSATEAEADNGGTLHNGLASRNNNATRTLDSRP